MMYNSKKCSRNLLHAVLRNQISLRVLNRIFCTRRNSTAFAHAFLKCQKVRANTNVKTHSRSTDSHLRTAVQRPARSRSAGHRSYLIKSSLIALSIYSRYLEVQYGKYNKPIFHENYPSLFECTSFLQIFIFFEILCINAHAPPTSISASKVVRVLDNST